MADVRTHLLAAAGPQLPEVVDGHADGGQHNGRRHAHGVARAPDRIASADADLCVRRLRDPERVEQLSEQVARLIPTAQLVEPPANWPDTEWNDRMAAAAQGEGLFAKWPQLAPQILAFAKS